MLAAALVALAGCGGGGAKRVRPSPTFGEAKGAEAEFRPMMRRWALGTLEEREELTGALERFTGEYPRDPLIRLARVLLAFNAIERGELSVALRLVEGEDDGDRLAPLRGPPGTTRDLAYLVMGAVERRNGDPEAALAHLAPLLNKMLDSFATVMLDEELVVAALGARKYADAIVYMEAWRQEAQPGTEREIEARLKELLASIPALELMGALDRRAATRTLRGNLEMARLVAQQLAVIVVSARDTPLARQLLTKYGALLGDYGEAVARLAVVETKGRVLARTVGLLLTLRTTELRRRSADVVSGMSFGLELPGSGARLVTREADGSPESVREALNELAGEGAAVIVAGIDPAQSAASAAFAADNALPVVLLAPDPSGGAGSMFTFELGPDPSRTTGRLAAALTGMGKDDLIGLGPALGEDEAKALGLDHQRGCVPAPSGAELRVLSVDGMVVYDGAACGPALRAMVDGSRARLGLGLGVPGADDLPASAVTLAAGVFPIRSSSPDARLASWLESGHAAPSWWAALGRDGAVLAWSAVRDLEATTTDVNEVRARRLEATSALAAARAALWTSDVRGFTKGQALDRTIELRGGP